MEAKIKKITKALEVITKICPCYGEREDDPFYIVIGNGLQLKDKDKFITSGTNRVAEEMVKRYGK